MIWDNRGTMHKVSPYDASVYRRVMHRTEVSGDAVQLAAWSVIALGKTPTGRE